MSDAAPAKRPRDRRLDFFRGLAMLIIFIAHLPDNSWNWWIPARFGFSSAAELFVFCSGFASALAFGSIFVRRGWRMGAARIAVRLWEVYRAHIGLFLILSTVAILATRWIGLRDYSSFLSLDLFRRDAYAALVGATTLTFVPDLLNILPMYLVLLAMIPLVMALAKVDRRLVFAASLTLWAWVQLRGLALPNMAGEDGVWFFNPFAWQLLFFTGFSFGMGWLPAPDFSRGRYLAPALGLLALCVPFSFWAITDAAPAFYYVRNEILTANSTTDLHAARYLHFLVFAYAALALLARRPQLIDRAFARPVVAVGRQSLATFLASLVFAALGGVLLDMLGRNGATTALVNMLGLGGVVAVAYVVAWFKSKPWAGPPAPEAAQRGPAQDQRFDSVRDTASRQAATF